jgi:pimeloyl-ACP methyl ester carboxylesterase
MTMTNPPTSSIEAVSRVTRRHVFYAYGFDPATAARYRRLIMASGEGHASAIAPMSDVSVGWTVTAGSVETTFEVLAYEDIVTKFRSRPAVSRLASGFAAWLGFLSSGGARRAWRLGHGPIWLWLHPLVMTCLFLLAGYLPIRVLTMLFDAPFGPLIALICGGALGLWLSYRAERAVFAHLMLALFEFMFRLARGDGPSPEMDARLNAFADSIANAPDDADEVLVVGHSLGGWVAVRALAKAASRLNGRRVGLLTLGSVAGFITCRGGPSAETYAHDVGTIAADRSVFWTDVSAPRDWFSFGLVDPLCMVADPPPGARSPRVISAKFGRFRADPADWRTRFQPMGLHMKYLSAPDVEGGFDPFATMCGPQTLEARYAPRRNSPKAKMRP